MKVILLVVAFGLVSPALAGNFAATCLGDSIKVSGKMLTANCRTTTGQYKCSKLDLNNCIKNSYGRLQEDPTGSGPHFGDPNQCLECSNNSPSNGLTIGITPALLWCKCNPGTGAAQASWPTAIFDLNTVVTNRNGVLECFKSKGTSC